MSTLVEDDEAGRFDGEIFWAWLVGLILFPILVFPFYMRKGIGFLKKKVGAQQERCTPLSDMFI